MKGVFVDMEHSLWDLLMYDPKAPLIFSSGLFLFLFAVFAFFYSAMRREVMLRIFYVICFSLYFYYKSSGIYFLLLIFTSVVDFAIGKRMALQTNKTKRKLLVTLSLLTNLGMLGYFKYTNFFIGLWNDLGAGHMLDFQNIFLPVGISFFVFQSLSYTIDIYRGQLTPLRNWLDYLFYLSFFPMLVAGPIVRARDFVPQIRQSPVIVARRMFGQGVFLILSGLIKKAVISDYISFNFVDRIFDNPALYSGVENLMGVYGYALQIYCDFSGYSDMAIGIALLLGFRVRKNFYAPYKSATITEFWRRWHISLSTWLRDYLYISLGGNRKGKARTYLNLLITMLLGGLWHGAALRFVLWGAIHGVALAGHKMLMNLFPGKLKPAGEQMSLWGRLLGVFITFNIVSFSWIFFRSRDMATAGQVLTQIFTSFNGALLPEVIAGYLPIFLLMLLGYALHFMPTKFEQANERRIIRMPLILQALLLALLIWFIMQIKSAEIQPFIYFQF
jgi:D-alanyl-lipoteichoic acid acyltransferase DltB (MBOAT superfamily)